ncbi:MAG: hypothetical protein H6742_13745 [Alphaproteobacteria bacterium]|nr:hypothetical protein [Alphaproteobacteria bacterium]
MRRLVLLLPLLCACQAGMAGDWAGELACADEDFDGTMGLTFALNRVEDDEYIGTGTQTYTGQVISGGATRDLEGSLDLVELVATVDGDAVAIAAITDNCEMTIDGQAIAMQCGGAFEVDATWDGGDSLEIDDGDCSGELTR